MLAPHASTELLQILLGNGNMACWADFAWPWPLDNKLFSEQDASWQEPPGSNCLPNCLALIAEAHIALYTIGMALGRQVFDSISSIDTLTRSSYATAASMQAAGKRYSCQNALEEGVHDELNFLLAKGARHELKHDIEAYAEQERRPAKSAHLSGMVNCTFNGCLHPYASSRVQLCLPESKFCKRLLGHAL